jgi:hypothetical protein
LMIMDGLWITEPKRFQMPWQKLTWGKL